jgi:hypothetical protein
VVILTASLIRQNGLYSRMEWTILVPNLMLAIHNRNLKWHLMMFHQFELLHACPKMLKVFELLFRTSEKDQFRSIINHHHHVIWYTPRTEMKSASNLHYLLEFALELIFNVWQINLILSVKIRTRAILLCTLFFELTHITHML